MRFNDFKALSARWLMAKRWHNFVHGIWRGNREGRSVDNCCFVSHFKTVVVLLLCYLTDQNETEWGCSRDCQLGLCVCVCVCVCVCLSTVTADVKCQFLLCAIYLVASWLILIPPHVLIALQRIQIEPAAWHFNFTARQSSVPAWLETQSWAFVICGSAVVVR